MLYKEYLLMRFIVDNILRGCLLVRWMGNDCVKDKENNRICLTR